MKSKNYITLSLVLALILSSCGSLSITQRRYSRGINIDWLAYGKTEKPEEKKANVAKKKAGIAAEPKNSVASSEAPSNAVQSTDNNTVVLAENTPASTPEKKTTKQRAKVLSVKTILNNAKEIKQKKQSLNHHSNITATDASNDSDVHILILIILAIIIPPLAVFLYYGEINTQFWISLILTLLAIGLFGGGYLFGWGVPVVHALLVILGIFG